MTDDGGEKLIRAFVALELPPSMRARLEELIETLRGRVRGVRWVRPDGIHLTLRFLGYARRAVLQSMAPALQAAAADCPPGDAVVSGLGTFPESGRVRVLWIGISAPAPILRLQQACERAATAAGFEPEGRAFRPHLTLGRWGEPARRPSLPETDLGPALLERLVLYRSQPGRAGSIYTPLETFPLGAPATP